MKQTWKPAYPVDQLTPHPDNPRRGNIEAIQQSIDAHGFYGAVLVQQATGRIIAGEHRWKAAQAEGMEKVPALLLDCTDDEALRIMLVDNRTTDTSYYDDARLLDLLNTLDDDLTGTGFDEMSVKLLNFQLGNEPNLEDDTGRPQGGSVVDVDDIESTFTNSCPSCGFNW